MKQLLIVALALAACRTYGHDIEKAKAVVMLERGPMPAYAAARKEHRVVRDPRTDVVLKEQEVLVHPGGAVQRDGILRTYWPDGSPRASRRFRAGVPEGEWQSWYENGQLESHVVHGLGDEVTEMSWWYPDGTLAARGGMRRAVKEGAWTHYFPNGRIESEGAYVEGLRSGPWRDYWEVGGLRGSGEYREGRRVGEWTLWTEDGVAR